MKAMTIAQRIARAFFHHEHNGTEWSTNSLIVAMWLADEETDPHGRLDKYLAEIGARGNGWAFLSPVRDALAVDVRAIGNGVYAHIMADGSSIVSEGYGLTWCTGEQHMAKLAA